MNSDVISDIKVWKLDTPKNGIVANCVFTVGGMFVVKAAIRNGQNGLFVSLPGRWGEKNGEKTWYNDVRTVGRPATDAMNAAILAVYNGDTTVPSQVNDTTPAAEDDIPF